MTTDETLVRDRRGYWKPESAIAYPPVFIWPPKPASALRWMVALPGYLFPWNALFLALAVIFWTWLTPDLATLTTLEPGWIGALLARNAVLLGLFYGGWHLWLYVLRRQGDRYKYSAKWPDAKNPAFLLGTQTRENVLLTFASALPIWTAWEVLTLWLMANGWVPVLDFQTNPIWFIVLLLIIPIWRDLHFYAIHRLIHFPPLYRAIHKLHHKNINPGPWSGLSMHPGEHLLYFSCVAIHFVVPSHPVHALFNLLHAALAPAQGHSGFDRVEIGSAEEDPTGMDTHAYAHYLHHRYFNCNYADGVLPLDKWFGSFDDGSRR